MVKVYSIYKPRLYWYQWNPSSLDTPQGSPPSRTHWEKCYYNTGHSPGGSTFLDPLGEVLVQQFTNRWPASPPWLPFVWGVTPRHFFFTIQFIRYNMFE